MVSHINLLCYVVLGFPVCYKIVLNSLGLGLYLTLSFLVTFLDCYLKKIQDIQSKVMESCFLFLNKHLRGSPA